jgi:hypothetical protein
MPGGVDFAAEASVCLPIVGGRAEATTVGPVSIGAPGVALNRSPIEISFSSAASSVRGDYNGTRTATTTTVETVVRDILVVSRDPATGVENKVEVASVSATLESKHTMKQNDQTKIRVIRPAIDNLRINGTRVGVTFAPDLISKITFDDLKHAYQTNKTFRQNHKPLFKIPPGHRPGNLPAKRGVAYCTIIKKVTGLPAPVVLAGTNEIVIPNFGILALGEMFVYTHERRLSLLRFALGSPTKGDVTFGGLSSDGNGWPP